MITALYWYLLFLFIWDVIRTLERRIKNRTQN